MKRKLTAFGGTGEFTLAQLFEWRLDQCIGTSQSGPCPLRKEQIYFSEGIDRAFQVRMRAPAVGCGVLHVVHCFSDGASELRTTELFIGMRQLAPQFGKVPRPGRTAFG